MTAFTTDYAPNSIDFEQQADSATKPSGKPLAKPQAPSLDEWCDLVMVGTVQMATDEEVRRSIAAKLS